MLLELAIGDAYGAGFEYADDMQPYNDLSGYVQHPRHATVVPGNYTDDTQMSLAIAELILENNEWTPLAIAQKFVDAFHRDPREGYAGRFYGFLQSVISGEVFLDRIEPHSDKSGAAMRASPIGVFSDLAKVLHYTEVQAKVTHDTADGIVAAQSAALMTHYCIHDLGPKAELGLWLESHLHGHKWSQPYRGKVKAKGWMSVRAAITALMRNNRLSELLKDCIAFTGDVDTVATIALAAASCSREYEQDLPQNLVNSLENGLYGRSYLIKLDEHLLRRVS